MHYCWVWMPVGRPTFAQLLAWLQTLVAGGTLPLTAVPEADFKSPITPVARGRNARPLSALLAEQDDLPDAGACPLPSSVASGRPNSRMMMVSDLQKVAGHTAQARARQDDEDFVDERDLARDLRYGEESPM
jgi:hypothetical protein